MVQIPMSLVILPVAVSSVIIAIPRCKFGNYPSTSPARGEVLVAMAIGRGSPVVSHANDSYYRVAS